MELTKKFASENNLTVMMVTHNMQNALDMGNRVLMMDSGKIVLDIDGDAKKGLTVNDLLNKFKEGSGKTLDNDRILLS